MKGLVFNLLEDVVTRKRDAETWCDLVEAADVSGVYTSLGSYPDEDLLALVDTIAGALAVSRDKVFCRLGREFLPLLAARYPEFFAGHGNARSFVLSVNDMIHPEVRKLYAGAGCPQFAFHDDPDGRLRIGYSSPRQMCHLAQGFVEGAGDYYGQSTEVEQLACMRDGANACEMAVRWS